MHLSVEHCAELDDQYVHYLSSKSAGGFWIMYLSGECVAKYSTEFVYCLSSGTADGGSGIVHLSSWHVAESCGQLVRLVLRKKILVVEFGVHDVVQQLCAYLSASSTAD